MTSQFLSFQYSKWNDIFFQGFCALLNLKASNIAQGLLAKKLLRNITFPWVISLSFGLSKPPSSPEKHVLFCKIKYVITKINNLGG